MATSDSVSADVKKLLLSQVKGGVLPKRRIPGLSRLLDKYYSLNKEQQKTWEDIRSSCTHAESDVEFSKETEEDTLGNLKRYTEYRAYCRACRKTIGSHILGR